MAEENTEKTAPEVEQTAAETTAVAPKVKRGKKGKRIVQAGEVHIQATFNNTIISATDKTGATLAASSAGANGFRGSKKGTAYAAQIAAEKVAEIVKRDHGTTSVDVFVKGIGLGRDSAIRAFSAQGITINSITDKTPIPHGGCRPKGERKP
ncbi:30S ribosomal protein S11 [Candidatus Saccharibacteria bacterium]|nr:30S ribosomal protein S11 [Candidatus Saccharibacteria bacterium]